MADNDPIALWQDSGPLANHGIAVGTPRIKLNIRNGYPAVRLTSAGGPHGFDLTTPINYNFPWTAFVVAKPATPTSSLLALSGDTAGATYCCHGPSDQNLPGCDGYVFNFYDAPYRGDYHLYTINPATSGLALNYVDGNHVDNFAMATLADIFRHIGFGRSDGAGGHLASDGDLLEILFCRGNLTVAMRQNAEKTIGNKYEIWTPAGSVIDLLTLPGVEGWWQSTSIAPRGPGPPPIDLSDGDTVDIWKDKTPNNWNHALKVGSPIFKEGLANGKPVVRLDGPGDGFNLSRALPTTGEWTVLIVARIINPAGVCLILGPGTDAAPLAFYFDGSTGIGILYGYNRQTYSTWRSFGAETSWHVFTLKTWTPSGVQTSLWLDGAGQSEHTGPAAHGGYVSDFNNIGYRGQDSLFPNNVEIAEIVFCNQALPDTYRQNGEKTLATKYSTPAPPAGSEIDLATLPGIIGWWAADSLKTPHDLMQFIAGQVAGATLVGQATGSELDALIQPGTGNLVDSDPISTFPDFSGNGHDGRQIGSARPIFKTGVTPSGKPALRFTSAGQSSLHLANPISSATPWTAFVVMKVATTAQLGIALTSSIATTPLTLGWHGPTNTFYVGSRTAVGQTPSVPVTTFHLFTTRSDLLAYMDGSFLGLTGAAAPATGDFDTIGAWLSAAAFSDADLAALIFCNQILTDTDRANAEKTLSVKYGTYPPPGGTVIDLATLPGLEAWWEADLLPTVGDPIGTTGRAKTGSGVKISVAGSALTVEKTE